MSRESIAALLAAPEEGWTPIEPPVSVGTGRSFVSGDPEGDRLRVRYFRRARDGALVGRVWFGPGAEGPPGHAHGGSMAAVLDEAMGAAAWMAGHTVVAARVTINFRSMLLLESDVLLEAWVDRVEGRKVITRSRLVDRAGGCCAEGEGLFVVLDAERFGALADHAAETFGKVLAPAAARRGSGDGQ